MLQDLQNRKEDMYVFATGDKHLTYCGDVLEIHIPSTKLMACYDAGLGMLSF